MSAKKHLLFLGMVVLATVCWLVLSSWYPHFESFAVKGKVEALYGNTKETKIRYTQNENLTDLKKMYEFDVTANGDFSAIVNVASGGPVYFYVEKEGYTTSRIVKMLNKKSEYNDLGTIHISSLYGSLSYKQMQNETLLPKLSLYDDFCLNNLDDEVAVNKICYFDNLRLCGDCATLDPRFALLTARVNVNGKSGKPAYFKLQKLSNGDAVIAEQPLIVAPEVVDGSYTARN